jgi:hypothetical protein
MKQNSLLNKSKNSMLGLALFSSTTWVIFYAIFNFFSPYNSEINYMAYPYMFLCTIYPLFLLLFLKNKSTEFLFSPSSTIDTARLICLWVNVTTIACLFLFKKSFISHYIYYIFYFYGFLIFLRKNKKFNYNIQSEKIKIVSCIFISISLILIYSETFLKKILYSYQEAISFTLQNHPKIFLLYISLISISVYLLISKRINKPISEHSTKSKLLCIITYLSTFFLLDTENSFEIEHYNAYIGPAISVLHGKVPLLDIFCQYGLSYLIFTIGFLFLPNNYGTAALIVSMLNIAYLILFLAILRIVIRNPYHFLIVGITTVFGVYFSIDLSIPNLFPSSLAFRYFPSTLFLVYLLKTKGTYDRTSDLKTAGFLLFNAMWSLESILFSIFIYAFYCFININGLIKIFNRFFIVMIYFLIIFSVCVLLYWISFSNIPNYLLYAKHFYSYLNPSSEIGIITKHSIPYYPKNELMSIIPIIVTNFTVFYFSLLCKNINHYQEDSTLNKLYLINFYSLVFLSYKALRSSGESTYIMIFMSFIPMTYFFGYYIKDVIIRISGKIILLISCLCLLTISFFKILYVSTSAATINNGLIGHLAQSNKPFSDNFLYNLSHFCTNRSHDRFIKQNIEVSEKNSFHFSSCLSDTHEELNNILKNKVNNNEKILVLSKNSVESLFQERKYNICLPNPVNDELFPEVTLYNISLCLNEVKIGDTLILDKFFDLYDIQLDVLESLSKKFNFKKTGETKNFLLLEIALNYPSDKDKLITPIYFTNKISLINGTLSENMKNTTKTNRNGETRLEINLKNNEKINQIRIWRKSSNKNPMFIQDKDLFIKKIDLYSSEDGENWDPISHDNNDKNIDTRYYEINFSPLKTRYIKIIYPDKENKIYIRRIDIFNSRKEIS